ncbi:dockerin type I domain-containing protein [Ruminococcus sp.]|uniref:dockerin type I repeat-containing protein n=1 Tax=Ruminococcus sp. TaxID=41978 RepID=UPI00258277CF|nr:dockerin type I domain-containing protein [Ruminococcus sp.]MCR5019454.1 hypothetical protein [Ruminococcus sp.]
MARNLSKDLKRMVAGLCAVLIVGGAVPLQPLVNFGGTIKAAATDINSEATYNKDSPELVDGVVLKKGESIDLTGTKNRCRFYPDTKVDFYSNGSDISYRGWWIGVTRIYVDDQGNVKADVDAGNNPYTTTFIPENGYTFKFMYNTQQRIFEAYQVLNYVKAESISDLDKMMYCPNEQEALDWAYEHRAYESVFLVIVGKSEGNYDVIQYDALIGDYADTGIVTESYISEYMDEGKPVYYIPNVVNTATLSPSGFVEGEDYAVVGNVTEVSPGDVVTIYSNKKFKTDKDYTTLDFEKNPDTEGDYEDFKYKCTMRVIDQATFGENEVISFIEEYKVTLNFQDLTETDYAVDYDSNDVYVTDYVDIYTNKRFYLNDTNKDYIQYDQETQGGGFIFNGNPYLYRYHVTFPGYPLEENGTATFIAEKNVDLEFNDMVEGMDYVVEGGLDYAYVKDGSVIYSNQSITTDISKAQLVESIRKDGFTYNEKNYKFKYDVTYQDTLNTGDTVTFTHVHEYGNPHVDTVNKPDTILAECIGENGENVGTVELALLQPKEVYHYGDLPVVEDVVIKPEQLPNGITKIEPLSLSIRKADKATTQETFTDFGEYELSAVVNVGYDGKDVPCTITKTVMYAPRSLTGDENSSSTDPGYTGCQFFLKTKVTSEEQQTPKYDETLLTVENGVVTIPDNTFTYNGEEQKPTIVVKNTINGTVTELTQKYITSTVEAKEGATPDNEFYEFKISAVESADPETDPEKYTGEATIKWRIEKAENTLELTPKDDIVYDGEKLDINDFNADDKDDILNDDNIKLEFEGSKGYEYIAPDDAETPYQLTEADNGKLLTPTAGFTYNVPTGVNVTYQIIIYNVENNEVKSHELTIEEGISSISIGNNQDDDALMFYGLGGLYLGSIDIMENVIDRASVTFEDNVVTVHLFNDEVYELKTGSSGDDDYDITSAGEQKGKVTITSDNYKTKVIDFKTAIAKKEVTVAPNGIKDNEKNTITWGELIKDSDVLYTQDGVVEKDKPKDGEYNFGLIFTPEGYNFEDAKENDAGEYKLVPSQIFAEYNEAANNYLLVLPKNNNDEQNNDGDAEEDVKLDTLTIVPYELTKDDITIVETEYQYDSKTKEPKVTATAPYSVKNSDDTKYYTLTLGNVESHDGKDAFIEGVRYDNTVSEKNISVKTDDTTSGNFTAGEKGVEFKWYIKNGTLDVTVGNIIDKVYNSKPVPNPTITVVNQNEESVKGVTTKLQYQKKDEETGEFGEAFDDAPKDAGTYRAVVTANANSYDEGVGYSNEFTISKRTVKVTLTGLPEVVGYKDTEVSYTLNRVSNQNRTTGIVGGEVPVNGKVIIEAGKQNGDHITNEDLPEITEALGNNYTFEYDVVLNLANAKLARIEVSTAYIDKDETIDPEDYFKAYDENDLEITDRCKVINIDNINQVGEYTIEVKDDSADTALTGTLIVKEKYEEIKDLLDTLSPSEDIALVDKKVIEKARESLDNMSDEQAAKVDPEDIQKLEDLEEALKQYSEDIAAVEAIEKTIDELPAAEEVTKDDAVAIAAAREAYDALTEDQKSAVKDDMVNKLAADEKALQDIADNEAADAVENLIDEIGEVAFDETSKAKIDAADEAYNALTDDQKTLVENKQTLDDAKTTYDNLIAADNNTKAGAVDELINDIGEVAFDEASKAKIDAADEAYNALTDDQKELVQNKQTLDDAKTTYDNLKAADDKNKADTVKNAISALPAAEDVTKDNAEAIAAAQKAYDELTDEQKDLIDPEVVKKLTDAAAAVAALEDDDFVKGDVSGDGKITVTDVSKVSAYVKGKSSLTDEEIKRADVNGDGMVNISDVSLLSAHVKGRKAIK